MKYLLFFTSFLLTQFLSGQIKTFNIPGNEYVALAYNTLTCYTRQTDSLKEIHYGVYKDSLIQMWQTRMLKSINDCGNTQALKINGLDSGFNLIKDFGGKVFVLSNNYNKHLCYLKDDSTLIYKSVEKALFWETKYQVESNIYKIDLGNDRSIYWSSSIGIIFKKDGELNSYFPELESKRKGDKICIEEISSPNMETDYFDYGDFKISRKRSTNKKLKNKGSYIVSQNNETLLDCVSFKYFNQQGLIAYDNSTLKFFDAKMHLDSQFSIRDVYEEWDSLEFLIGNKIKKISVRDYTSIEESGRPFGCGNVSRYTLRIFNNSVTQYTDYGNNIAYKKKKIKLAYQNDSMLFVSRKNVLRWDDNGGFNSNIILFKNSKEGLFSFENEDSFIVLHKLVPILFDKIDLLNGVIILSKTGRQEFLEYYLQHKQMRFTKIDFVGAKYFRYTKPNATQGWTTQGITMFNDLQYKNLPR